MYTDNSLILASSLDVSTSGTESSGASIGVNPDHGSGEPIAVIVVVETYTVGSSTHTRFDVMASPDGGPPIGSTGNIEAADLELADDAARVGGAPFVIRINPGSFGANLVNAASGGIFLKVIHTGADPSAITVTAQIVVGYQSSPESFNHVTGMLVR